MSKKRTGSGGPAPSVAVVDGGKAFWGAGSGKWAGEQMLKAMQNGGQLTTDCLRTLDTLRKNEWQEYDAALVEAALIRLRGVADLIRLGLTRPITGGFGKTMYQFEKITAMTDAAVSLDGMAKSDGDRQEFELGDLPLPITHKDFYLNLRTLLASRERGEALDTTQVRMAGRKIAEKLESMLFLGGPTFGGSRIYGLTNHPDINNVSYSSASWDNSGTDGQDILKDVLAAMAKLESVRHYGPYLIYVPTAANIKLEDDFKANVSQTIRQRIESISGIQGLTVADQMPAGKVVVVQATVDVVAMVVGEPLQTIQWDIEGGFQINFKGFTVQVPLVRSDVDGRSGVCIIS
jgi:uncharacterized linocin/CFP29 family protein